jgi:hypothetical protein
VGKSGRGVSRGRHCVKEFIARSDCHGLSGTRLHISPNYGDNAFNLKPPA